MHASSLLIAFVIGTLFGIGLAWIWLNAKTGSTKPPTANPETQKYGNLQQKK